MSSTARQRAAQRRANRRHARRQPGNRAERAARDSGAAALPDDGVQEPVTDPSPPADTVHGGDDDPVDDQPAESTVSSNREALTVTLRRRDRQFLEALAVHWECTPAQCIDRLVRRAHVQMRATTGPTMRWEEFQHGDREPGME